MHCIFSLKTTFFSENHIKNQIEYIMISIIFLYLCSQFFINAPKTENII